MHLFVPYDGSSLAQVALREACRMATPLDRVTVMAPVLVPRHFPVDVQVGWIWHETTRADRVLKDAQRMADTFARYGAELRGVQVQARTATDAILAGAAHFQADSIVIAVHAGPRGRFAGLFGTVPAVIHHAPCEVRVIYVTRSQTHALSDATRAVDALVPTSASTLDLSPVPDDLSDATTWNDSLNTEGMGNTDV